MPPGTDGPIYSWRVLKYCLHAFIIFPVTFLSAASIINELLIRAGLYPAGSVFSYIAPGAIVVSMLAGYFL